MMITLIKLVLVLTHSHWPSLSPKDNLIKTQKFKDNESPLFPCVETFVNDAIPSATLIT